MADQEPNTSDAGDQQLDLGQAAKDAAKEAGEKDAKEKEAASSEEEETYTKADWDARETEWNKRYSGLDTKLTTVTKDTQTEIGRLSQALADAEERTSDAAGAALLRKVEEDSGDIDVAKAQLALQKQNRTDKRANEARKIELDARDTILAEAGKGKTATDLITEFELDKSASEELLACDSPEKMRITAQGLHIEKLKAGAKTPVETDSNRGGQKVNLEDMNPIEALGQAMEGKI